jgi:hypothetical protein
MVEELLSNLLLALDASQREIRTGRQHPDGSSDNITGLMVMTPELSEAWEAAHLYFINKDK